jgi:general secretion pathway protein A
VYTDFFGLNEKPFSISPDPRYLYLSPRHADALAHLLYGISESGGFIQLTGEVGTGKTTLIRSVLEQLPDKAEVALILNPQLSTKEFLESICEELRIPLPADRSTKGLIDTLNAALLQANAQDRRVVLIVDEAQTLSPELLEQVRLLTNLETPKQKLLQIILIGQPELRAILARPEMRQVAQRITGRYHLEPLTAEETVVYVNHRMRVAGAQREIFRSSAMRRLYKESDGIPRLINVVADRALLAAYTQERTKIDGRLVREAAREVFGRRGAPWWPWVTVATGIAALALTTATQHDSPEPELDLALAQPAVEHDAVPEIGVTSIPVAVPAPATPAAQTLTPQPEPQPEPHPEERLHALLGSGDFPTDITSAVRALFALWNVTYEPDRGTACAQASAQQLQCFYLSRGSVGELRRLNRPAMLALVDESGNKHQVVLSRLDYDSALLTLGGRTERVGINELTHYWYGENLILSKPVFADLTRLVPGSRSESVPWLRDGMQRIFGTTITSADPLYYDEGLAAKVREFQRRERLTIDGIVGTQTQIALQTALRVPDVPLLYEAD